MITRALAFHCPACGSADVCYTCLPNCCFNHVCSDCRTTFEPVTVALGEKLTGVTPPDPLPDASDPTVACIKCDSTAVYMLEDGRLVCAKCGALLKLELTEVVVGG